MYLANWGPQDISGFDLNGIDVINYAFVSMRQDGSLTSGGDYARGGMQYTLNKVLKDRYPGLRTVFSIGGWTDSQWFSVVAADPTRRARFADAVRSYMVNNRFDGVDIDWEYPGGGGQPGNTASQDDARNFVLMVRDIRDRIGQDALITAAVSADVSKLGNYAVPLANLFDWINVMTYDMAGGWSGSSGLNAPLDDQARAMEGFVRAGVPRAKLSMGLAFYGRGFFVDSGTNGGLGQRITGLPSMDGTDEPGVWAWRGLRRTILAAGPTTPAAGWQRTYLSNLHTPTLWNAARRIFVGYDDTVSTCNKAKWVREQGYGGVMVWEFTQDFNSELARATTEAWRGLRPNC
ncbi:glycoside hydrolase [Hyaloraphidium curvatum]|nr:glycoside hydrolase [Hyaloraphidium curvatum]